MATVANDLIRRSLRRIGAVGATEQPSASQIAFTLDAMNGILDSWRVSPETGTNNHELVVTLPPSTPSLTIGPGQTISIPRPMRIESAYARYGNIDRNIEIVDKSYYDSVSLKSIATTWPQMLWYDGNLPTGNCYFWPQAASNLEIHITVLDYLAPFASPTSSANLPDGYARALMLATAVEIYPTFFPGQDVPASLAIQASNAYRVMMHQNVDVPDLYPGRRTGSRLGDFLGGGF